MADVQRRLSEASERLDAYRAAHESRPPVTNALTPGHLLALQLQGVRTAEDLAAAAKELRSTERDAETARAQWLEARSHRRSAERLVEKRRLGAASTAAKASHAAMDEMVTVMWERRAAAAGGDES